MKADMLNISKAQYAVIIAKLMADVELRYYKARTSKEKSSCLGEMQGLASLQSELIAVHERNERRIIR